MAYKKDGDVVSVSAGCQQAGAVLISLHVLSLISATLSDISPFTDEETEGQGR